MDEAIIDTTVLTDILLNSGEAKDIALKAIKCYRKTFLPVYAIKEFKAGPLGNFVWFHNKFISTGSYEKAIDALQRMSRTPKRYTTSTALQALKEASGSIAKKTLGDLLKKYGETATHDKVLYDEFRLTLKSLISVAWKKRRKITTEVISPLSCYREVAPYEKRGLIEIKPTSCDPENGCSMSSVLRSKPEELHKMREAILGLAPLIVRQIFEIIRQINAENNTTIFLVEQNANLALKVAHRGYVMENGAITMSDSASNLLSNEAVKKAYLGL
jgi:hypothetical protein